MRLTTIVLAGMLALFGGETTDEQPPRCVGDALGGEAAEEDAAPAPRIDPASGGGGTQVRVEGEGFPAGTDVMLVAIYGEDDCTIVGVGDQLLGATRVDPDGIYRLERPWPATFVPLLGRGSFPATRLPDGRYYVAALPCAEPAACSLHEASEPGGPYVQGKTGSPAPSRHASPLGAVTGAGAGVAVILAGLLLLRRLVT